MSAGKKIWDFLWKSNSVWSWLADLVLIFVIVKFVIFPLFALGFGTSLPFVIIESGSLEHKIVSHDPGIMPNICGQTFLNTEDISGDFEKYWGYCGAWYEQRNITKEEFEKWPWQKGMNKGDIIVVKGLKNYDYKEGEIIIFRVQEQTTPIIHRIIAVNDSVFSTKGDHNSEQHEYEKAIAKEQIVGKAIARIPKLGWIKLGIVELFR
jgi:hypothetical protein